MYSILFVTVHMSGVWLGVDLRTNNTINMLYTSYNKLCGCYSVNFLNETPILIGVPFGKGQRSNTIKARF